MTKSEIKKAVKMVEEIAGEEASRKLLIIVKAKGLGREGRQRIKESFEREFRGYPGSQADLREAMKGVKPGYIMQAHNLTTGYHAWEGDFVGVYVDGSDITSYRSTGNVDVLRPSGDFTLSGAQWLDTYSNEMVSLNRAVRSILENN